MTLFSFSKIIPYLLHISSVFHATISSYLILFKSDHTYVTSIYGGHCWFIFISNFLQRNQNNTQIYRFPKNLDVMKCWNKQKIDLILLFLLFLLVLSTYLNKYFFKKEKNKFYKNKSLSQCYMYKTTLFSENKMILIDLNFSIKK